MLPHLTGFRKGKRRSKASPFVRESRYRLFRCRPCRRTFNERTGTPFNHLQAPTDSALLVVL